MRKLLLTVSLLVCHSLWAQDSDSNLHLQITSVSQEHGEIPAAYSGKNSLTTSADRQTSLTWTLFVGQKLWHGAEVYADPELAGGSGFNKTQGIAGFPNGEIYRVDDASPKWSLARLYAKQVFNLGGEKEDFKDDKNQLAASYDRERVTLVLGKFALNDFFDNNSYSHDPRTQFLNWAFMDNGAWDYAADTRGYSWGFYLEYNRRKWAVRWASVMVPKQANQMELDTRFLVARGDNLEFEYRYSCADKPGVFRWLAYLNHAEMGDYRTTINTPAYAMDVTQSRALSVKYGLGVNLEQALTADLGAFFRASWNDGHTETWNFTEIDRAASLGLSLRGNSWKRGQDTLGVGILLNAISDDHRDYLANGGYGFIVGDGRLSYQPEEIAEIYYLYRVKNIFDLTGDYQFVEHPAYNSDRGPVSIFSLRLHYEI